jgi:hypothetical protein
LRFNSLESYSLAKQPEWLAAGSTIKKLHA